MTNDESPQLTGRWRKIQAYLKSCLPSPQTFMIYFILPLCVLIVGAWLVGIIIPPPGDNPPSHCQPLGGMRLTDRFTYWRASRNIAFNQREFTHDELYVHGNPRKAGDVLIGASEQLSKLADSIRNHLPFVEDRPRLIFLYGAAGSGKSAVVGSLQEIPDVAFFDVGYFFRKEISRQHPDTTMENQLVYNNAVISRMPQLHDSVLGRDTHFVDFFERYLGSADDGAPSINPRETVTTIVDGLDEIHPVSATRLIDSAWRFLEQSASRGEARNIVLSGRGEAFREFFVKDENNQLKFIPVYVKPLDVYHEPLLSWHAADWQWWENGRRGDAPGDRVVQANVDGVRELMRRHSDVRNFMFTLYPANLVYDHIGYHEQGDLIGLLFDELVRRNARRHYRPASSNAGEVWRQYTAALVQVARMALRGMDEDGSFVLAGTTLVCINGQSVSAAETLNHSGLIDLYPFERTHLEYRWFPLPLLKHLAEGRVLGQTYE